MKLSEHADHTERLYGVRAEDIHKWIDQFFDAESFRELIENDFKDFDPYNHRKFRHCTEALEDAYREFKGRYTKEQIKNVFECHLKDDYYGYLPHRADFENETFIEKYHDSMEHDRLDKILSTAELKEYFKGKNYTYFKKESEKVSFDFRFKIVIPTIAAVILFISAVFFVIIPNFKQNMIERKKEMIKELTNSAASIIQSYILKEKSNKMTRSAAQQEAAEKIKALRYGADNKNYFWITDMYPRMIMHPYRPELDGADLSKYRDQENKSGKFLFVEFVNIVKDHNEGYSQYMWQWMDNTYRTSLKISYVKRIAYWDWIIGTGVYMDDVEKQTARLTDDVLKVFLIISLILIVILVIIVSAGYKIENERRIAEAGLKEAKDRYRALVEASKEGYILEIEGKNIYTNHIFRDLVEYSEKECSDAEIWQKILKPGELNKPVIDHLAELYRGIPTNADGQAQITSKTGKVIDVIMHTSRIFFSNKNGHVISVRPVVHKHSDIIIKGYDFQKLLLYNNYGDLELIKAIRHAKTSGQVINALNELPKLIFSMAARQIHENTIRQVIEKAYDAALTKFVVTSLRSSERPSCKFAFISLGSNARGEMTLFSDQDNALVFEDTADIEAARKYFTELAQKICNKLNRAGYAFCPGGIMASNPKWCLSVSEWKKNFTEWITHADEQSLLEINVFFDLKCSYGSRTLTDEIHSHIFDTLKNSPQFFILFAKNCLLYKPPLNMFGQIKAQRKSGALKLNIKECLKPVVIFARIYALKHGIKASSTLERLCELNKNNIISDDLFRQIIFIFNHLWSLRFRNQVVSDADLRNVNDGLDLHSLNDLEHEILRDVLSSLTVIQTRLVHDYLGGNYSLA